MLGEFKINSSECGPDEMSFSGTWIKWKTAQGECALKCEAVLKLKTMCIRDQVTHNLKHGASWNRFVHPSCAQVYTLPAHLLRECQSLLFKWNSFLVLNLGSGVVDGVENEDSSQIVCIGAVGNTHNLLLPVVDDPSASFRAPVLASGRQTHVVRQGHVFFFFFFLGDPSLHQ